MQVKRRSVRALLLVALLFVAVKLILDHRGSSAPVLVPLDNTNRVLHPPLTALTTPSRAPSLSHPKEDDGPWSVRWNQYVSIPSGNMRVISIIQDHRAFPNSTLSPQLQERTFSKIRDGAGPKASSMGIFQFHLAVRREFYSATDANAPTAGIFQAVELWWADPNHHRNVSKLPACGVTLDLPHYMDHRYSTGVAYLEFVLRGTFFLPPASLVPAQDLSFAVFAAGEMAVVPLTHVLHYPHPVRLLPPSMPGRSKSFPTAPWADSPAAKSVIRATGDDAQLRVGVWVTKKYTWTTDDELWLLWILDIVGVDHVVIEVNTEKLSVDFVRQRLALHDGLGPEHVSLVSVDVPTDGKSTFFWLQELLVWDAPLRWQADLDYAFGLDLDEFVQLFSPDPPYHRVDVHTFLARHLRRIQTGGHAVLTRYRIERSETQRKQESLLPAFLQRLLALSDSRRMLGLIENSGAEWDAVKSIFYTNGSIQPFLHFNLGYPREREEEPTEAHILHVREGPGPEELIWWLTN